MDCANMMMEGGMVWMMGAGVLAWILVIALLVTIVVLLARLLKRTPNTDRPAKDLDDGTPRGSLP